MVGIANEQQPFGGVLATLGTHIRWMSVGYSIPGHCPVLGRLRFMSVLAKDTLLHLNDMERGSCLGAYTRAQRLLDRLPKAQDILVARSRRGAARRGWLFGGQPGNRQPAATPATRQPDRG